MTVVLDSAEPQAECFAVNKVLIYEGRELTQTILPEDVSAVEVEAKTWRAIKVLRIFLHHKEKQMVLNLF